MEEYLKAKIENNSIKFLWLGKWRPCRYYQGKAYPPSKKIIEEALTTFRMNAGPHVKVEYEDVLWMDLTCPTDVIRRLELDPQKF